jgi:hypothetical protein
MFTEQISLDDEAFIVQFEQQILPKEYFNHIGHLRLAYLYLQQLGLEKALDKISNGISTYAESLGVKDKFHVTITYAVVNLIYVRQAETPTESWQLFIEVNDDMVKNCMGVLDTYFSTDVLMSEKARCQRVEPDKKPFYSALNTLA